MEKLHNKVVWVIGASSGIGKATAEKFYQNGAKVILSARRTDRLEELQKKLLKNSSDEGSKVRIFELDIKETEKAEANVSKVWEMFGGIDIVVFSSGISNRGSVVDTDMKVHREIMEVNYFGVIAITKAILPKFIEIHSGNFIVISSIQGKFGIPDRSPYAASKHALHGFFESLKFEMDKFDVKVLMVCPGYIKTELSLNALSTDGSPYAKMDQATADGYEPEYLADEILKAFCRGKEEIIVAQTKAVVALYLKTYLPSLFSRIMKSRARKSS